jgi:hypothetical protein
MEILLVILCTVWASLLVHEEKLYNLLFQLSSLFDAAPFFVPVNLFSIHQAMAGQ